MLTSLWMLVVATPHLALSLRRHASTWLIVHVLLHCRVPCMESTTRCVRCLHGRICGLMFLGSIAVRVDPRVSGGH